MNGNGQVGDFAEDFRQQVLIRAANEDSERFRLDAFTEEYLEYLAQLGEVEDPIVCYLERRGLRVNAYSADRDDGRLDLFVSIPTEPTGREIKTVTRDRVTKGFGWLKRFLEFTKDGRPDEIEASSQAFDMVLDVRDLEPISTIRLFVLTDGRTTVEQIPRESWNGVPIACHVWDIDRLSRGAMSGKATEPISVDFVRRHGRPLPCLLGPEDPECRTYLVLMPGQVLADLYEEFGAKLLEHNIRTYLQARNKVNKGIRDTIIEKPNRFLAYNNGISTTAEAISLQGDDRHGDLGVARVEGFQIVNGAQTTASLFQAAKRDRKDISKVDVACKITVVDPAHFDDLVPWISRFANTQNKINEADFETNHPFHVRLEALSRTIWAPPVEQAQRQTKWFYERARGQYQEAKGRQPTPGRKRQFEEAYPTRQRFTKTDVAKFENSWGQLPAIVSRGAQKNFARFMKVLADRNAPEPTEEYFQWLVAKAILFKRTERLVDSLDFGGYRAQIVTYTIASLSRLTAQRIDLDQIWRQQGLGARMEEALTLISKCVHRVITSPPDGANITEWCKSERCWTDVAAAAKEKIPSELIDAVSSVSDSRRLPSSALRSSESTSDEIEVVPGVGSETWFELAQWARQTNNLQPWERSLAFNIGKLIARGLAVTPKQAIHGRKIWAAATGLGFNGR